VFTRHSNDDSGRGGHPTRFSALGTVLVVVGLSVSQVSGWQVDPSGPPGGSEREVLSAIGDPTFPPFVVEPSITFKEFHSRVPTRTAAVAAGVPLSLAVPKLGVDVPVIKINTVKGVLLPPSDPQTLGWWAGGARPGAAWGSALITGHTVSTGGGAFDDLENLRASDDVRVRTPNGVLRYTVTGVTIYRKASLAKDAERVFSQTVPGRLVLITCEDWNGYIYLSNVVVFADLVEGQ